MALEPPFCLSTPQLLHEIGQLQQDGSSQRLARLEAELAERPQQDVVVARSVLDGMSRQPPP